MIYPKPLNKGDTVAITATSGICNAAKLHNGIRTLENLGLNVKVMESCYARHGEYLAGKDDLRVRNLHQAFADKNVKGVLAARGGHGAGRLLPLLDYHLIRNNPKIFVGFSDVTALHIAINQFCGLVTFHGPMPAACFGSPNPHPLTVASFAEAIFQSTSYSELPATTVLYPGQATGIITGGNLSVVASTLGTPYEIKTRGRILFLEETQEEPYRVDRLLLQLKLAGKLSEAAGIAFGDFSPASLETLHIAIQELVIPEGKPTIWGLSCGHTSPNLTLPLGSEAILRSQSPQKSCLRLLRPCPFSQTMNPS